MTVVSERIGKANAPFAAVRDFYLTSRYSASRQDPDICDFTFGNPHEAPLDGVVAAIREHAYPAAPAGSPTRRRNRIRRPSLPTA